MLTIALNKEFIPLVLCGRKVTTIRKGRRDYPLGKAAFACEGKEYPIIIQEVAYRRFNGLTDETAWTDGFSDLTELESALRSIYPDITEESEVTIVRFTLPMPD